MKKSLVTIWNCRFFKLIDYRYESDGSDRKVFKYIIEEIDLENDNVKKNKLKPRSRIIPSDIKKEVWERDKGKCVICGATDELHFDHAATIFKDPRAISLLDEWHSNKEERWVTIGLSENGHLLVVHHTYNQIDNKTAKIRIISSRKATKKEKQYYRR